MTRWRIELRDAHGARDGGTLLVEADNMVKAKHHAVRVCRRRLSGHGTVYLEAKGRHRYGIVLEQEKVGEVRITRLTSDRTDVPHALRALQREPRGRRGTLGSAGGESRRGAEPGPQRDPEACRKELT